MIIWNCTIVHRDLGRDALPPGSDTPMREAVEAAFTELTGVEAEGTSSGWGRKYLSESDEAALDMRPPDPAHYECWKTAQMTLAALEIPRGEDFTPTHGRYEAALSALTEALFAARTLTELELT